jgi:hypothetical protein
MSNTDRNDLPAADQQRVVFHVDYGSPGGFAGTLAKDPAPDADLDSWAFYADGQLIARGDAKRGGWTVQVSDHEFIEAYRVTQGMLEDLFERGSRALMGLYEVFASPFLGRSSCERQHANSEREE